MLSESCEQKLELKRTNQKSLFHSKFQSSPAPRRMTNGLSLQCRWQLGSSYSTWQMLLKWFIWVGVTAQLNRFELLFVNTHSALSPGDKPKLQQCGPYTFIETREKHQVRFENNGERVIFKEFKYYYFDQARTNGSLDDIVIVPNIPDIVSVT